VSNENAARSTSNSRPDLKRRLGAWWRASRPPYYIATVAPLLLGFVLAHDDTGQWRVGRFLLVNLGAFMVHLATNLADDLFDHILGADAGDSIGGSRGIQRGLIAPRELAWALVALFSASFLVAVVLVRMSGRPELWGLVLFAALSSLFYVAPPVKYGYRGLGEASAFINMGPIMVGGAYLVLAEAWTWDLIWYSLPIGLMVANILYFQSLPDMETDRRVGKYTLAVRLGKMWAHRLFRLWWLAIYLSLISLYFINLTDWLVYFSVLTLPLFFKVDRLIRTTDDWVDLDRHGHLIRKMYLINSALLILAV
jgi:1,4-dihydroxy-2-naphthoate octaprenyltransferase